MNDFLETRPDGTAILHDTRPRVSLRFLKSLMLDTVHVAPTVTAGGTLYPPSTTLPLVFSPGGGAAGFVTINASGVVISATLTNGGSFPLGTTPTVAVSGNASTGATALAHLWR